MEKYCISAIIIYGIIFFLCIIYLIYDNIEPIKTFLYEIKSKTNKLNNDIRLKENISFIFKNYNISIYNKDEIEKDLMNISNNLFSNITTEKNYLLLQKDYFLLKILNIQFEGNATHIDSLDNKEIFNSFQDLISYTQDINSMNRINFSFYKGLNKSSEKDIIILEEKTFSNKRKYFITDKNALNLEIDENKNLFKTKFTAKLLNDNNINNMKNCNLSIEIISKLDYNNLTISKDNINYTTNISSINLLNYNLLITSQCSKSLLISSFAKDNNLFKKYNYLNLTNLNINKTKDNNSHIDEMNGKKIKNIICNLLLIIFSIINIIYSKKFKNMIEKKIISVYSVSIELLYLGYFQHIEYFLSSFSFIRNYLNEKESLLIKLFYSLGCISVFINVYENVIVSEILVNSLMEVSGTALPHFRALPTILLLFINKYKYTENIWIYLIWYFQIINNIIYNNKYTFPLFYKIFSI